MSQFENTMSIMQYAQEQGLTGIDLIKNPKTGKLFGKDSKGNTYRVSNKITELTMDLSVSTFTPEDGDTSLMIHPTGSNSANVVSTLSFGTAVGAKKSVAHLDEF